MLIDKVASVNFYPLKSAHAATVDGRMPDALTVGSTGFEVNGVRDRDFLLFDPADGCFVSQRGWDANRRGRHSKVDRQLAAVCLDVRSDHTLVTSSVGQLELPNRSLSQGTERRLNLDIFGKTLPVIEQPVVASSYFSRLLEREVILVRSDRDQPRVLPKHYRRTGAFNQVAGADGFPFLLVSEASLAAAHVQSGVDLDAGCQ